jgi:Kef-type K+ transport system membrane component KefB
VPRAAAVGFSSLSDVQTSAPCVVCGKYIPGVRLSYVFAAASVVAVQADHGTSVAKVVLALAVILAAAKLGGHVAVRLGQPSVLGELVAGAILGNLHLAGAAWFQGYAADPVIDALAQIGVLILLFQVGLESTVREMARVGVPSLLVALLGVVVPFGLGWGVGTLMLPERGVYVHAFLGATLTATSVGITARVLGDLGKSKSPESRVILGAAVIDDILGLVILAIVTSAVQSADLGTTMELGGIAAILAKALAFLVGAVVLGLLVSPRVFRLASRLQGSGVLLITALVFCFTLSYLAAAIGLAMIVGAYAAGLILEHVHYRDFTDRGEHGLEELLAPVAAVLVPVFFVVMGMRVDITAFARVEVLGLAALLTAVAVVGKLACALGVRAPLDRLSVGLGMLPRGEVGLIFAGIGLTLTIGGERVLDEGLFSAIVIMVIVTTMMTPPLLKWSLGRSGSRT